MTLRIDSSGGGGGGGGGTVTGTGVPTRIAFWDSVTSISSDASLYWDNVNKRQGIGTSTPTATLDVLQPVATSGAPQALLVTGGAHTGLPSATEVVDIYFDLSRNVEISGGDYLLQRTIVIDPPTYDYTSPTDVETVVGLFVNGPPIQGTNATFFVTLSSGVLGTDVPNFINLSFASQSCGISDGVGDIPFRVNMYLSNQNIHLGDQTATLDSYYSLLIEQPSFDSTTNTRTVTNATTVLIAGEPVSTGNVVFTNTPLSLDVSTGPSHFGGTVSYNYGNAAAANDMVLSLGGNFINVTGSTNIQRMSTGGGFLNAEITLFFIDPVILEHNIASGGGFNGLLLAASVDYSAAAGDNITFVNDGTNWREISRTAA